VLIDPVIQATTLEELTLEAEVNVFGTNSAYTGDITYQWFFGDGSMPPPPVSIKSNGTVSADHVYPAAGTYTGFVTVSDGETAPVTAEFDVEVTDPVPPDAPDLWAVEEDTDGDLTPDVFFDITFESAPGASGTVLTGTKVQGGVTSLAFGVEMGPTIFWIDMELSLQSWGVGNTYFGNKGGGEMSGVVITPASTFHTFAGEEQ
jgi:hypothetical protein